MRHALLFSLCFALFFISFISYGQKVNFNSKTAKQKAGEHVIFFCTLSELESPSKAFDLAERLKLCDGILKTETWNFREDKVGLILISDKKIVL